MEKKLTGSGAKAHQRTDVEWRSQPYSDWHRTLDRSLFMLDVDFIEWRFRNGQMIPVGVMEITRVDTGKEVNSGYLSAILSRYQQRDMQAKAAKYVAAALKTNAYIVLFRQDCSEFWVHNLSKPHGWNHYSPSEMETFLKAL